MLDFFTNKYIFGEIVLCFGFYTHRKRLIFCKMILIRISIQDAITNKLEQIFKSSGCSPLQLYTCIQICHKYLFYEKFYIIISNIIQFGISKPKHIFFTTILGKKINKNSEQK